MPMKQRVSGICSAPKQGEGPGFQRRRISPETVESPGSPRKPHEHSMPGDFVTEHLKILPAIHSGMKHVHRANNGLCDMVWIAGRHHARKTGYGAIL